MPPTPPPAIPVSQTRTVLAMGTRLSLQLPPPAAERALAAVARVEAFGSTWCPDTPWSQMAAEPGTWVPQSEEAMALLTEVRRWHGLTQGCFDPLLAPLVQAHGLRTGGRTPSQAERDRALALCGPRHLELDPDRGRARILTAGAGLEEGGFLKGHALDEARAAAGTASGLLDFGGQLLAWGAPVRVGIADPADRHRERLHLRLEDASLATTSCAERGRHLLDPATGSPCPAWGSVSVVHPSALVADLLSTALYVMGPERGLAWARSQDLPALFLPLGAPPRLSPAFRRLGPLFHER